MKTDEEQDSRNLQKQGLPLDLVWEFKDMIKEEEKRTEEKKCSDRSMEVKLAALLGNYD